MGHNNPISFYCHPKVEMRGKAHADEEHRSFVSFMYGFLKAEAPFLQEPPWLYDFSPSPGPSGLCSYLLHLFDDSALSRLPSTCREKRLFPPALPSPPVSEVAPACLGAELGASSRDARHSPSLLATSSGHSVRIQSRAS